MVENPASEHKGPLTGMRVVDLANGAAGPFASTMLADFGAEVVKIERPGTGDAMRHWDIAGGVWWKSISRGKRSIAVDLSNASSRDILKDLIADADVLVESFRPGVLERLGYGPEVLFSWNPKLIVLRVSGYGQTGPYKNRPGYGKAAEAFACLLHMTGFQNGPPVFVGFPIADMTTGLMGAFGVLLAWIAREKGMAQGQVIDLALYETIMRLMDYVVPVETGSNVELVRNGNRQPMSFSPAGVFKSKDEKWVVFSAATPDIVRRVITLVAGEDRAAEPKFRNMENIRNHLDEIDELVAAWCVQHTGADVIRHFTDAQAVAALANSPAELVADPHVLARESITPLDGEDAMYVNVTPRLSQTPGKIRFPGPMDVGADGMSVLRDVLKYDTSKTEQILASGAVRLPSKDD